MYEINKAAVVGAGTMGLGIAGQLANAGVEVLLLDRPSTGDDRNAIPRRAVERLLDKNQPGLLHQDFAERITIGNIDDDLNRLAEADWIAEAVVEKLDTKKALYRQIDEVRKRGSIVTSNTSTIPISLLVEDMPEDFRAEFAITHFFNPVRFMRLLELVRGEKTHQDVMDCLEQFCEARLGKGIVVCNDTPGFLGNRVGVYAIQTALHEAFLLGLKPEEADAIFGRPLGIPKTGVFGLYDLIGIDLMSDVARSLVAILPGNDEFHRVSAEVPVMQRMISEGRLGNKGSEGGFYRADPGSGAERQTLDFESFAYREFDRGKPQVAIDAELAGDFTLLLKNDDIHSRYAWEILARTLCYAVALVPDVNESLVAIDDAMKLGYNWVQGPFEMIDAIGVDRFVERLESDERDVPDFLRVAAGKSFYRVNGGVLQFLLANGEYRDLQRAAGVTRFSELRQTLSPESENKSASYFVLPQDIGLIEFHSKANTLDSDSMHLIAEALQHAERNLRGLVIHNDAQHFSCGVNLEGVLSRIVDEDWQGLDDFLDHFQQTCLALRYATVPVVAAPCGLSLGGGFELLLHSDKVIYHANSVTGLVESLVGVVPGGGGVKEMLYRWYEHHHDIGKAAWETFMHVGYGKTAASPLEAAPMMMFRERTDEYVMNRDRLLDSAIAAVLDLATDYSPGRRAAPLPMAGREVWTEMTAWLTKTRNKGHLTPHDAMTGMQIAMIVSGGDVDAGTPLTEDQICGLERKAFLTLAGTPATRARIEHMLSFGTPLRN
ncbi:MAG: 3-hydroxyacyl-CoA dehydrogenase NAD-binding domain-containing protein [Gammaproteobacteria bacterium]|nr:3-hydroxyacyl-CoA dehydrogenase NAD-binding domain-containing protein [Gammaproteobacteria bacterium]